MPLKQGQEKQGPCSTTWGRSGRIVSLLTKTKKSHLGVVDSCEVVKPGEWPKQTGKCWTFPTQVPSTVIKDVLANTDSRIKEKSRDRKDKQVGRQGGDGGGWVTPLEWITIHM